VKDVKEAFEVLYNELKKYNPELLDKEYMVVLSKADLLDEELKKEYAEEMNSLFKEIPHLIISSVTQYQLTELKDVLWKLITK
ncbi:MAG: GTPase ObgE, partial [Flavobacteriaceae bacterium]|nr:GTPase ObgE [Flavobacteriaceae bacterium]